MAPTKTRKTSRKKKDAPVTEASNDTPEVDADIQDEVQQHASTQVDNEPVAITPEKTGPIKAFEDEREAGNDSAIEMIPFDKLYRRDNVRTAATLQLEAMIKSLTDKGFKKNHPIVVSQKPDGKFLVLCGNRRTEALEVIQGRDQALFERTLPGGLIPAVVHTNLDEGTEILIRIDHGADEDRVGLDDWGEFLAVKQLVKAGYSSQNDVAAKLGKVDESGKPKRSWVQQRVNLARLPRFVQDEMERYCTGGAEASHLRWSDIAKLFELFTKELKQGFTEGDGPELQELWTATLNPVQDPDTGNAPKPLSGKKMEEMGTTMSSSLVKKVLLRAAGKPTDRTAEGEPYICDWAELDDLGVRYETAHLQLTKIAEHMGQDDFNATLDAITAAEKAAATE